MTTPKMPNNDLMTALGGLRALATAVPETQALRDKIRALPEPPPIDIAPLTPQSEDYPGTATHVLVGCTPTGRGSYQKINEFTPTAWAEEIKYIKKRAAPKKITAWDEIAAFFTGKPAPVQEKIDWPAALEKYGREDNLYLLDRARYEAPAIYKTLGDTLKLFPRARILMMTKFLARNEFIDETIKKEINPALRRYGARFDKDLKPLTEATEMTLYQKWGFVDEAGQLPGYSFYMLDYETLGREIAQLEPRLTQAAEQAVTPKVVPRTSKYSQAADARAR